ncbi:serine hydrolase [Microbulbifer sp. JSM ZJ756]|uniref:serine hydrolase n=1 Tax=Microbulbifer sp. JSM ZJ756 TaxID=3376191 RepID=UPI0037B43C2F
MVPASPKTYSSLRPTCWWVLLLAITCHPGAISYAAGEYGNRPEASGEVQRTQLRFSTLVEGNTPLPLLDYRHYAVPDNAAPPGNHFTGRLQLSGEATGGNFRKHRDRFGYTGDRDAPRKHLPEFDFELVQSGSHIFPLERGSVAGAHPDWEFILAPGRVWDEQGDRGYSRVALPFALQERNANCIHNGVMTFLFRDNGDISDAAYQIAGETCAYYQMDLWGKLAATYTRAEIPGADLHIRDYRAEIRRRLRVKPLAELGKDFPGSDHRAFSTPAGKDPAALSLVGYVIDGIHYTGGCQTRQGQYPYCDSLVVPSYSVAKSVFAGGALMRLERRYPGSFQKPVAGLVPECAASENWQGVSLNDLLDMASGNFTQAGFMEDEQAEHTDGLFLSTSHREKIHYSCSYYPRKGEPGTDWAYHTSDTYILGTAMNTLLRQHEGPNSDIFTDLLYRDLLAPLGLSATAAHTRRTYDQRRQPFTGWGLYWLRDDIAKIARFFNDANNSLLHPQQLAAARQQDPADRGPELGPGSHYNNGFWGLEIGENLEGCESEVWIPYMTGYGGVVVLLLPNNSVYYYFADDDAYDWLAVARAAHNIRPLCPGATPGAIQTTATPWGQHVQ